jgi:hypothetical protein
MLIEIMCGSRGLYGCKGWPYGYMSSDCMKSHIGYTCEILIAEASCSDAHSCKYADHYSIKNFFWHLKKHVPC